MKTVRQLRKMFFDFENLYAVLFADELTNKEVRGELYEMYNQDRLLNWKQEGDCILIWK